MGKGQLDPSTFGNSWARQVLPLLTNGSRSGVFLPYIVLRGQVFAHEQCYRFLFVGKAKLELEALNLCHRPSEICGQRQVLPFVGMGRVFAHEPLGFRI